MSALLVGYARCSTDAQDLTAQRDGLAALGVAAERIDVDHRLTGTQVQQTQHGPFATGTSDCLYWLHTHRQALHEEDVPSSLETPGRAGAARTHLLGDDPGSLITRGAIAGLVAGLAFVVATIRTSPTSVLIRSVV